MISRLELQPVFDWLSEMIWQKGRLLDYDELMTEATGEKLNPDHFLNHLRSRYL